MNLCSIPHYHPATPTYARTARDTSYSRYTRRVKYRLLGISSIFRNRHRQTRTYVKLKLLLSITEYREGPCWSSFGGVTTCTRKLVSDLLEVPVWTQWAHKLHHSMCIINVLHTIFSARLASQILGAWKLKPRYFCNFPPPSKFLKSLPES